MGITDKIGLLLKNRGRRKLLSVEPDQTVFEALQMLATYDVGALLVTANGKLVGIFSERDYARKCILLGHDSHSTKVQDIMTTPVLFVGPHHSVDECMAMMTEHHFRHLPVLEDNQVVGVVSIGDLVKWVIDGHEQTIHALQGYITDAYPR